MLLSLRLVGVLVMFCFAFFLGVTEALLLFVTASVVASESSGAAMLCLLLRVIGLVVCG